MDYYKDVSIVASNVPDSWATGCCRPGRSDVSPLDHADSDTSISSVAFNIDASYLSSETATHTYTYSSECVESPRSAFFQVLVGETQFYDSHLSATSSLPAEYCATADFNIRCALASMRARLISFQPQVYIDDSTMEAAFVLVQAAGMFTLTALAASLWVAVKLLAVRSTSPCRQLVCMASGIDPPELSSAELGLCKHFNWNMSRIVREAGIVC